MRLARGGLLLLLVPLLASATPDEEFVGPFSSWADVTAAPYHATGDGSTDDTSALQAALDDVGTSGHSPVLYLPAGTYKVTNTLTLGGGSRQVMVIGQDPSTTTLKWAGSAGGTLLRLNGLAYSKVSRLTFDGDNGANDAGTLIDQSLDPVCPATPCWPATGYDFDTGNGYSDLVLKNASYGLRGGLHDQGFAETTMQRVHFLTLGTGAWLGNYNALDLWIWDSLFENCTYGIQNFGGNGDYKVYNSLFKNNELDIGIGNPIGTFAFRYNTSVGSGSFLGVAGGNTPAILIVQGNIILDPVQTAAFGPGMQGPNLFLDNIVRSQAGASGAVISNRTTGATNSDLIVIGNTFTTGSGAVSSEGRVLEQDTSYVDRSTLLGLGEPTLPPTPPQKVPGVDRTVYEVAAGSSASTLQTAIDQAVATGNKAVVHLAYGDTSLSTTLTIPTTANIQLLGDGHFPEASNHGSALKWTGGAGTVLDITGPVRLTIRDLGLYGNEAAGLVGLTVRDIDQPGARVILSQAELRQNATHHLFVNGLDHARLEVRNTGMLYGGAGNTALRVVGGPLTASGATTSGQVAWLSGLTNQNGNMLTVSNKARVVVQDIFNELHNSYPVVAALTGAGQVTLANLFSPTPINGTPAFAITDYSGTVSLVGVQVFDHVVVSGDGTATQMLTLGMIGGPPTGGVSDSYSDTSSPAADARVFSSRQIPTEGGGGSNERSNIGALESSFLTPMLAQLRALRATPLVEPLAVGVTDLRLDRVWATRMAIGIQLDPGGGPSPVRVVRRLVR